MSGVSDSGEWAAPGYTEIRELGAGATGRVVLAREDAGGRLVAVKYLAPRLVGDYAAMCGYMSAAVLKIYSGVDGCPKIMAGANGFVSSVGTSLADERKAASVATVDASQVTVTGDTAVVPASAVHVNFSTIKVLGQSVQFRMNDVTWVKEGGRWKIGVPKNLPSVLPTQLFTGGSIPTDLFPTDIPTSLLGDLPTDFPTDLPTG